MTDDQQTANHVFTREHMHFARQDLERSERLSLAVTLVWLVVAVLAMVLTIALVAYCIVRDASIKQKDRREAVSQGFDYRAYLFLASVPGVNPNTCHNQT